MITAKDLLAIAPELTEAELKAKTLSRFAERLLISGRDRGVTALRSGDDIRHELILDSLQGLASLPRTGSVIDIGTGGGVPGLVLAILRPDLPFTLTDSALKKTTWVKECVEELELANVTIKTARLELLGRQDDARELYCAVTAKALASVSVLVELAMPLLRVRGKLIAYKGSSVHEEIDRAARALKLLSAEVVSCRGYRLAGKDYFLLEVQKMRPTGQRFPRRDGKPQRQPL